MNKNLKSGTFFSLNERWTETLVGNENSDIFSAHLGPRSSYCFDVLKTALYRILGKSKILCKKKEKKRKEKRKQMQNRFRIFDIILLFHLVALF